MTEENISQFTLKNIYETNKEIKKYEFTSIKHKNVCRTLNYIEHFLSLVSPFTGCISFRFKFL